MNSSWSKIALGPVLLAMAAAAHCASLAADEVDFARDVRPILAGHCFKCHGPDPAQRKADLRLDDRKVATGPAESGERAIVPGEPEASELMRRVSSDDADEVMPPPETKNPLSPAEREILKRWIAAGAEYQPHWAFQPPAQAPLPAVKQADWPRGAIDRFVLARMEKAGLAPSPAVDRYTLVRRVYLDLIGLPPTPDEVDAFVADTAADAYEKLVDRVLASPHYGERWARRWLDLARYADTNGYEKDRARSIWPYRDWVIGALNADMPFDQFTVEQLAGDMLPGATPQPTHRHRISPQYDAQRRGGHRPARIPLLRHGRSGEHHGHDLAGPDARLRPVPHAQVRFDSARRLLPLPGAA